MPLNDTAQAIKSAAEHLAQKLEQAAREVDGATAEANPNFGPTMKRFAEDVRKNCRDWTPKRIERIVEASNG